MLSRRSFLAGGLAAAAVARLGVASASIARALTLRELLGMSRHVVVGVPVDSRALWEKVGQRERIVTYTTLRIEAAVDERPPSTDELVVRTLGGAVGDIGQIVPGEAVLRRGMRATLFAEPIGTGVFAVAGMAQGHYPLRADARGIDRLTAHFAELTRLDDRAAVIRLHGRTVAETERLIAEEFVREAR